MFKKITIKGARVHNLKNIDVEIPREKLVVLTGISGSGKSSLAFDTIYAEGQRRYVESLSTYARQFLGLMDKPEVDSIEGLSPAISIDQRSASVNPRSTVGTVTEIYDYLRLLFSRIGHVHCPNCQRELKRQTPTQIIADVLAKAKDKQPVLILAPVVVNGQVVRGRTLDEIKKSGFSRVSVGEQIKLLDQVTLAGLEQAEIVVEDLEYADSEKDLFKEELSRAIELALDLGDGQISVLINSKKNLYSQHYICRDCGFTLPDLEPRNFSFNSPAGACSKCLGIGTRLEVDADLVIPNKRLTLSQGAIKPWARNFSNQNNYWQLLKAVASENKFSLDTPIEMLNKKALDLILHGSGSKEYLIDGQKMKFNGVLEILEEKHQHTTSDYLRQEIEQYMRVFTCPYCQGKRLKSEFLAVTVGGQNISAVTLLTLEKALDFFKSLLSSKTGELGLDARDHKIADQAIKEIISHLQYLNDVGLSYLTLDRPSATLSGGEAQRIRLATQLGLSLTGVVYILDEPSIGLHQKDNQRLIDTLKNLRDLGNTVIVVEHDSMTMEAADEIIDIGPGAGENGGRVVAQGTPVEIKKDKNSLTGKYLSGKEMIVAPKTYRKGNGKYLEVLGASEFNLKNVDVKIPLGKFICLTGVSGSGKSTLMLEILVKALAKKFYRAKDLPGKHKEIKGIEHIDKVIAIDQSPIGR
ncbi:MAG: excinuclease ABC subunit UvrA, partial [Patescibacteria group bacterium]|nr:excinuclease ABC subunit UvrA [Patescibacteria group bacterium]